MRPHPGPFSQKLGHTSEDRHATATRLSCILPGGPYEHTLADSHGAEGHISGFYATVYESSFNQGKADSPLFNVDADKNTAWSRNTTAKPERFEERPKR